VQIASLNLTIFIGKNGNVINIKEQIGQRILEARKAKGLTRKALADLTADLKQSRINNWERGIRTPGPEEVKQLAVVLDVSPAFLMCLADDKLSPNGKNTSVLIPLLNHEQACNAAVHIQTINGKNSLSNTLFISVSTELAPQLGVYAFALRVLDDSMTPEMRVNDIQVIDPSVSPKPGDYVAVQIVEKNEVIICQYKKLSYSSSEFELLTLNDNWPSIKMSDGIDVEIVGKVVQNIRNY